MQASPRQLTLFELEAGTSPGPTGEDPAPRLLAPAPTPAQGASAAVDTTDALALLAGLLGELRQVPPTAPAPPRPTARTRRLAAPPPGGQAEREHDHRLPDRDRRPARVVQRSRPQHLRRGDDRRPSGGLPAAGRSGAGDLLPTLRPAAPVRALAQPAKRNARPIPRARSAAEATARGGLAIRAGVRPPPRRCGAPASETRRPRRARPDRPAHARPDRPAPSGADRARLG